MLANEGWNYGLGYCVKIQHDDGTSTVYGHMSRVIAVTGQRVAQGQVIGKIGSTGVSTGPREPPAVSARLRPLRLVKFRIFSPPAL